MRDPQGLTSSTFVDLVPRKVNLTLGANPSGLQVTLDGQPVTTPLTFEAVVGIRRTIGAVSPQTSGGSTYVFQSWSDGGASTHEIVTPSTNTTYTATYAVSTVPVGIGLAGYYYDNIDFTGATVTRLDPTVNFNWGTGAPVPGIGADTFSVRWNGQVRAKVCGTTTFYTTSDDGVRLYVNNVLVVDNWTDHAPTENSGTIALTAGQKYDVRMETYENGGLAVAKLAWSGPGLAKEFIPQTHLYPYALLVTASTTLGAGDAAVRDRLTATGFTPLVRTGRGRGRHRGRRQGRRAALVDTGLVAGQHQVPHGGDARAQLGVGADGRPGPDGSHVGDPLRDDAGPDAGRDRERRATRWRPASPAP